MEVVFCLVEPIQGSRKLQLLLHSIDDGEAPPVSLSLAPSSLILHCARLSCHRLPRAEAEGLANLYLAQLCPLSTVMGVPGTIKGSFCCSPLPTFSWLQMVPAKGPWWDLSLKV